MSIQITSAAAKKICVLAAGELLSEKPREGVFFRIVVAGGGCSGFQYDFSLDNQKGEEDHEMIVEGAFVVIDALSLPFLAGSTLDFVEDLTGASFVIKNPNAAVSCGCGNSFSV